MKLKTKAITAITTSTSLIMGLVIYAENVEVQSRQTPILVKPNITQYTTLPLSVKPKPKVDFYEEMIKGVKFYEGFRSKPYYCCGKVKTIGYGFTDPKIVGRGYISEKAADKLLREKLQKLRIEVLKRVDVEVSDCQIAALVSFTFNTGIGNLEQLIDQKDRLNDGNYDSVVDVMPLYRKAGGKIREGLVLRRAWEVELYKGEINTERS